MIKNITNIGRTQRSVVRGVGHTVAAAIGGLSGFSPERTGHINKFFPNWGYASGWSANKVGSLGLKSLGAGLGAISTVGTRGARTYNKWRQEASEGLLRQRKLADSPQTTKAQNLLYGRNKDGVRRFGARTPLEHIGKGISNLTSFKHGLLSPMGIGLNIGLAAFMTDDNIFDPINGVGRHLVNNVGTEIGAIGGGALGAAAAAALVPGGLIAAGIGFVGGLLIGSEVGGTAADLPWKISEFGKTHGRLAKTRRSTFTDSEHAATMRQRALQSISRSQMNARSAFGQEALAYHA